MTGTTHIRLVDETGSTNADLAAQIRDGSAPAEGSWLIARRQTAGRGRHGREWHDGSGNFMGSTLVDIRKGDPPPASLSFVAALAVADAVDDALGEKARVELKWPNDALLKGGKVSGILLEMVEDKVVVGIGVNLASAPDLPDRKTAAISDFVPAPDLEAFAETLRARFDHWVEAWREDGLVLILRAFLSSSIHYTGSPVTVYDSDGSSITGGFASLDPSDGALRLRLEDGSERVIRAGDVT